MQKEDIRNNEGLEIQMLEGHGHEDEAKENKPAVQAVGADPFQCNFTNRQNQAIQQNCINF